MARVCTHGSGPNVARCRPDGHLEHTKAPPGKGRSECPHRDADGKRCGNRSAVLSERHLAELLGLDVPGPGSGHGESEPGLEERWAAEDPPGPWREVLAEPSGDRPCGGGECGCDDPPVRYTGAHTATICPACDTDCWELSATAHDNARKHEQDAARKAARDGTASLQLPQRELDQQARELRQRRKLLIAVVGKVLADPYLTGQCRSDFEWFAEGIPSASAERLAELEEQIREQPVGRVGWWRRSFGPGEIAGYLRWANENGIAAEDQEDADDDQADDDQADDQAERYQPGQLARLARQAGVMPGDDDPWADRAERQIRAVRDRAAITAARPAAQLASGRAGAAGTWCEQCKRERRYVNGTYPPAVARAEWPGLVPAPVDLCTDHLIPAMNEHGTALSVSEWFVAAGAPLRIAYENARRKRIGLPPLSHARVMAVAGLRSMSPIGAKVR